MKLEEGENYSFQVLKSVSIPEEGDFFLLRHQSGRRLMLPKKYYTKYNIIPGSTIECRVDKVSCTGKVYLEPTHPVYKIGNLYQFKIHASKENSDNNNTIYVIDIYDNVIQVPCNCSNVCKSDLDIQLKVENIKKGVPILRCENSIERINFKSLIGQEIPFQVIAIEKKDTDEEYFQLVSNQGYKSSIKKRHYKHYGINIGDTINCNIYDYNEFGELKVEPKNPYYTIDSAYYFDIYSIDFENSLQEEEVTITLKDIYSNKCGLQLKYHIALELKNKTQLYCRVIGFRKGKPRLALAFQL